MSCLLTVTLHIVDVRLTCLINITSLLIYFSVRSAVTFTAREHPRHLADYLYCLMTDAHGCERLAEIRKHTRTRVNRTAARSLFCYGIWRSLFVIKRIHTFVIWHHLAGYVVCRVQLLWWIRPSILQCHTIDPSSFSNRVEWSLPWLQYRVYDDATNFPLKTIR